MRLRYLVRRLRRRSRPMLAGLVCALAAAALGVGLFEYAAFVRWSVGEAVIGVIRHEYEMRGLPLEPIPDRWRAERTSQEGR